MKPRLNMVTLGVKDLATSQNFYFDALGWQPAKGSDENIIFYYQEGVIVSLFPFEQLAEDAGLPAVKPVFPGITLSINLRTKEAVDDVFQKALQSGAGDLIKPHETFWGGYGAYFSDPDGHIWEVAWGPMWEFDDQGSLKL